jgi:hypothetical protein
MGNSILLRNNPYVNTDAVSSEGWGGTREGLGG